MTGLTTWERHEAGQPPRDRDERQRFRELDVIRPCSACGRPSTRTDPLVLAEGWHVHVSHVRDPQDGFYGAVFQAVAS